MQSHVRVDVSDDVSETMEPGPISQRQERVNRQVYWSPNVLQHYRRDILFPSETSAFLRFQPAFVGRDVLDLGIGTGRTARILASLARRYVGVDYSEFMVQDVHANLPEIDCRHANMKDLSILDDGEFDFALAASNVIDALSHSDRVRALNEAHRVLRLGRLFVFSSHNRSASASSVGPKLARSRNPVTQAVNVLAYMRSMANHARVGKLRRQEKDYALLNDEAHEYACLHYYITRDVQTRQLEGIGFRLLEVFGASGAVLGDAEDTESPSLLYVAERV